jgi:alpha-1,2-mannosyltransferase
MKAPPKKLLLLFAGFLALQAGVNLARYVSELPKGGRFGGDFICLWLAAQRARLGEVAAIYNPDAWRSALAIGAPHDIFWFVYPPFALLGLWPLGRMTYNEAVVWWSLAPLPFYFALVWVLAKRSGLDGKAVPAGRDRTSQTFAFAVVGAFALPFLSANLFSGQTGACIAVFFLAAAYFWRDRPILAGICIGLVAVKPQLGVLVPFALLAAGQWRTIAGAAVTIVALAAAATLWLGVAIWNDYARILALFGGLVGRGYAGIRQLAVGPYVSLQGAGAPVLVSVLLQAAVGLTVLAAIVRVFWRTGAGQADRNHDDGRLDLRLGLLAAGALLSTPYALSYDTPMLVLAMIPLLARAWRTGWEAVELVSIVSLLMLPYAQPLLAGHHIPFSLCALSLMFGVLYRRYQREAPARRSGRAIPAFVGVAGSPDPG